MAIISSIIKPVLILAYNRPDQVRGLIDSMRPYRPQKLLVAVDGPKDNDADRVRVKNTILECGQIDWTEDVQYLIQEKNLGLRLAVPKAVSWAVELYGEVIVVEDDVRIGSEFFEYMSSALDTYRNHLNIGHISGYNVVESKWLKKPNDRSRASTYPESYAWATWQRAWNFYDDDLSWIRNESLNKLKKTTKSLPSAFIWKLNFRDANDGVISTWAYRWVASLWKNNLVCISPNRNLVSYAGEESGTHTLTKPTWKELQIENIMELAEPEELFHDRSADRQIEVSVFRTSFFGVLRRVLESIGLRFLKKFKN